MSDFEYCAIGAATAQFPDSKITGWYFHLCQSVWRKIEENGSRIQFTEDENCRVFSKMIPVLACLPPDKVIEAFDNCRDCR
jgi:hypothetical protein